MDKFGAIMIELVSCLRLAPHIGVAPLLIVLKHELYAMLFCQEYAYIFVIF